MKFVPHPKPEPRKPKVKQPLKRQRIKQKPRKVTGEGDMFIKEVWNRRNHECDNCCDNLGNEPKAYMFAHDKGKGAHNELRLVSANILLLCRDCHYAKDSRGKKAFDERKDLHKKVRNFSF